MGKDLTNSTSEILTGFLFCAIVMHTVAVVLPDCTQSTHGVSKSIFVPVDPDCYAPSFPNRLIDPGWTLVSDRMSCARESLSTFSTTQGFLYNETSGLCTPVQSFEGMGPDGVRQVEPEEGDLYVNTCSCPWHFQLYTVPTENRAVCLWIPTGLETDYSTSKTVCETHGGYLVSVKTISKRALVATLITGGTWVGLDDIAQEGIYIWQSDGTVMNDAQRGALFNAGEPNDMYGIENCIEISFGTGYLNDVTCYAPRYSVCEWSLLSNDAC